MVVATWNVHGCRGGDGRCDPERVARVVAELDADVVGLQEIEPAVVDVIAAHTGHTAIAAPTRTHHPGTGGNALLTRHRVAAVRRHDLSRAGREPRGALDVDLSLVGRRCRALVTHLGLQGAERRAQVRQLLALLGADPAPGGLTVLLGDLNEWLGPGRALRALRRGFACGGARSFPARLPLFALDRVVVRPAVALQSVRAHGSRLARIASDHLPVVGVIRGWT
ncbi:MAG: endonuclease/exonuclease/phosphatase family protein [bacterium]|nr:endonuclease/exonuclease/phosphatase family protein [bacterium]